MKERWRHACWLVIMSQKIEMHVEKKKIKKYKNALKFFIDREEKKET